MHVALFGLFAFSFFLFSFSPLRVSAPALLLLICLAWCQLILSPRDGHFNLRVRPSETCARTWLRTCTPTGFFFLWKIAIPPLLIDAQDLSDAHLIQGAYRGPTSCPTPTVSSPHLRKWSSGETESIPNEVHRFATPPAKKEGHESCQARRGGGLGTVMSGCLA